MKIEYSQVGHTHCGEFFLDKAGYSLCFELGVARTHQLRVSWD